MAKKTNPDDLLQDKEEHPDRGLINGKEVIREGNERVDAHITREIYKEVMLYSGLRGKSISAGVASLIELGLQNQSERERTEELLQRKATIFEVPPKIVIFKIYGTFKKRSRNKKLQFQPKSTNEEDSEE